MCECVCEQERRNRGRVWGMCVFWGMTFFNLISVFVCMLYFRLCMASDCVLALDLFWMSVCVVSVLWSVSVYFPLWCCCSRCCASARLCCAFDVSVSWLCIVAVVCFLCKCPSCAVLCSVWFYLFKQSGIGLPKVLLHLSNTVDDLESISTQWRRDYLSAIKLMGNLFRTTLCPWWFPLNLCSPLALMSNS